MAIASGSVTLNAGGTLTFTPNLNFTGPVSFDYTVADGQGGTDIGTVAISVTPANDPPTAVDDNAIVSEDSGANLVDVLLNDSTVPDAGETLTISAVTQGANGSVAIVGGTTVTYTPNADFSGVDAFTYTIDDGNGGSATATVNVTVDPVNDPPTANNDTPSIAEDSGANTIDALLNDSTAPDVGETLTVTGVTQGANGTVAIVGGGTAVTYTPNANFAGSDAFTYTVSDGNGGTASATVNVTVTNVDNDAPTILVPGTQITPEDTPRVFSTGNGNAISVSDPDAGVSPLQVTLTATDGTLTLSGTGGLSFAGGDGTADVSMTFTGTQAAINAALDGMSFTPTLNFTGTASVSITSNDLGATGAGGPQGDSETVDITVVLVNDSPIVTVSSAPTFTEGGLPVLVAPAATVTDVDSANLAWLEVRIVSPQGTFETLTANTGATGITAIYNPGTGVLTLNGADTVANYQQVLRTVQYDNTSDAPNASAVLNFVASDDGVSTSNVAATTVTIVRVNDAPTANIAPASFSAIENSTLSLAGTMSVADVDALPASVMTVSLSVISGFLTATAGTTGVSVSGSGTPWLTFTANLTADQQPARRKSQRDAELHARRLRLLAPRDRRSQSLGQRQRRDRHRRPAGRRGLRAHQRHRCERRSGEHAARYGDDRRGHAISSSRAPTRFRSPTWTAGGAPVQLTLNVGNGVLSLSGTAGLASLGGRRQRRHLDDLHRHGREHQRRPQRPYLHARTRTSIVRRSSRSA